MAPFLCLLFFEIYSVNQNFVISCKFCLCSTLPMDPDEGPKRPIRGRLLAAREERLTCCPASPPSETSESERATGRRSTTRAKTDLKHSNQSVI